MAILTTPGGDPLIDESSNNLIDTDDQSDIPPEGGSFPPMLMLRLRLHAAWLLFMLMPT